MQALDDSPDSELGYETEVVAQGAQAEETQFLSAADRVLAVLPICPTRDHGPTDPMRRLLQGCARPPDSQ